MDNIDVSTLVFEQGMEKNNFFLKESYFPYGEFKDTFRTTIYPNI